jgi:hypothetical protein
VVQNESFGSPFAVIEVDYYFNQGETKPDRTEIYTVSLQSANQFYEADTVTPAAGPVAPNVPDVRPVPQLQDSNLAPFEAVNNGQVTVRLWAGANAGGNTNKEFALAVSTVPEMARTSRVVIPYTSATDSLTVVNAVAVTPSDSLTTNPSRSPVDAVTVLLSAPALDGSFTAGALTLTRNGVAVPLNGTVTLTHDPGSPGYRVSGLAPFQNGDGTYVLTVNGTAIKNLAGTNGSGTAYASWTLDTTGPTVTLQTTAPAAGATSTPVPVTVLFSKPVTGFTLGDVEAAGAVLSNLRGGGSVYAFDVTPTGQGPVTVQIPAGAAQDAAGNASAAAAPLTLTFAARGPAPVVLSEAPETTNLSSIPVTVAFAQSVTGFDATRIVVTDGRLTNFAGSGTTYSFNLQPLTPATSGPQTVSVTIAAGAAQDAGGNPSTAAAPFSRVFDSSPLTGLLLSPSNQVTSASLTLVGPGTAGSLGFSNRIVIRSDSPTPVVASVSAAVPNGIYGPGQTIPITVSFSGNVLVSTTGGTPQLTLALANNQTVAVNYSSGGGTRTLTFNYTVATGQNSSQLAYASAAALSLNGGTILDATTGAAANLTLPTPGTVGSLSGTRRLVIDSTTPAPHALSVSAVTPSGVYRAGAVILIHVQFSGPVVVTGQPQLLLATGPGNQNGVAAYAEGSGSDTLTFRYTVAVGQSTALLDYVSRSALQLNGGSIRDARADRDAVLTLPDPSLAGSLSAASLIVVPKRVLLGFSGGGSSGTSGGTPTEDPVTFPADGGGSSSGTSQETAPGGSSGTSSGTPTEGSNATSGGTRIEGSNGTPTGSPGAPPVGSSPDNSPSVPSPTTDSDAVALTVKVVAASTVGAFDPGSGTWYLNNTDQPGAPAIPPFQYGAPGWILLPGDWDGNGTTTIGVFDPTTATWYLRNEDSAGAPDYTPFQYGAPGWVPVAGDWTGDGVTTIGVWRPSTATWYLRNSNSAGTPEITLCLRPEWGRAGRG